MSATRVRFGTATSSGPSFSPSRAKSAKFCGIALAEQRLASRHPEGEAGIDRHGAERGDEREDADIGDEKPVDEPAGEPGRERGADRQRRRTAADEDERRHDAGEARHRTDAEIEVAHRHHDRHGRGDHREHADLLGNIDEVARGQKRAGQASQKKMRTIATPTSVPCRRMKAAAERGHRGASP